MCLSHNKIHQLKQNNLQAQNLGINTEQALQNLGLNIPSKHCIFSRLSRVDSIGKGGSPAIMADGMFQFWRNMLSITYSTDYNI